MRKLLVAVGLVLRLKRSKLCHLYTTLSFLFGNFKKAA